MSEPTDIDNDEEEFAETTLIEAIENQIESENPPAAKATPAWGGGGIMGQGEGG